MNFVSYRIFPGSSFAPYNVVEIKCQKKLHIVDKNLFLGFTVIVEYYITD